MQDLTLLSSGPFYEWVQARKVQPQDLRFFSLLTQPELQRDFFQVTDDFFKSLPTYSVGLQALEIIVDLVLLGRTQSIPAFTHQDHWLNELVQLRNPMTSSNDQIRKQAIEKLRWPQGSKIKVERRGDRHGVEFKIFISSATDLTKMIASLERVKNDFPV